jgi:hypothetical protein
MYQNALLVEEREKVVQQQVVALCVPKVDLIFYIQTALNVAIVIGIGRGDNEI